MNLFECLKIKEGEIISVVGAGGKTSLIMYLAKSLKGRVVVSASTKMFLPDEEWPCFINEPVEWSSNDEVVVAANAVNNLKIQGLNDYTCQSGCDYYLIEADGSKTLKLKGWADNEPVITDTTTRTIGIIDMTSIGMPVNEDTIFRLETYLEMTDKTENITLQNIIDIILHKNGLFKNSKGRRILLLNKVETEELKSMAEDLVDQLEKIINPIDEIIVGSIKNEEGYLRGIM